MNMFEQMPFSEKYPVFRKLAEIGDLRKLSREELELYDEDIRICVIYMPPESLVLHSATSTTSFSQRN